MASVIWAFHAWLGIIPFLTTSSGAALGDDQCRPEPPSGAAMMQAVATLQKQNPDMFLLETEAKTTVKLHFQPVADLSLLQEGAASNAWSSFQEKVLTPFLDGYRRHLKTAMQSFLVYFIFIFCCAFIYHKTRSAEKLEKDAPATIDGFDYGLFRTDDCCSKDALLCFCSWCCTGIRWADTVNQAALLPYWSGLFVFTVLVGLNEVSMGVSGCLFLGVAVKLRQELRKKFNIENGSSQSLVMDCLVWCCCAPCAAAQEARQVAYVQADEWC
mmetsp:Transcript_64314/g.114280  ORF Transcript_64314/g.114280 Transcript_64314/m.114280 type:complete len:271 (+) Transcript_64314:85-897(+)